MTIENIGADTRNYYSLLVDTSGESYEVPPYQRSYAWEKDQWSDFWRDVLNVVKEPTAHVHFMGAMVFLLRDDGSWWVLDGQQRFATLLLMLAALRDALAALGEDGEDHSSQSGWAQELIAPVIPGSYPRRRSRRLALNRRDNSRFGQILDGSDVPNRPTRGWQKSEKLILNAYKYFRGELDEELRTGDWENPEHFVAALEAALARRLCHIRVEIKDQVNAQAVFEALNNRGIELTQADLIKNYLFMEVESSPDELQEAEDLWERTVTAVGEQELGMFLRYFWNSTHGFARMDDLQREVATAVGRTQGNVMAFVRQVEQEASLFGSLRTGERGAWIDQTTSKALAALKSLGLRTSYVLLLALCREGTTDAEKRSAVRAVLNFSVRYFTVGRQPANTLEKEYTEWAVDLRSGDLSSSALFDILRSRSASPDQFNHDFEMLSVKDSNVAKYLLREINEAILRERGVPHEIDVDLELEHTIPQSLTGWWETATRAEDETVNPEDLIYRIGNQTLLEKRFNIAGSNLPLPDKQARAYDASQLPTNDDLKSTAPEPYASFGPTEVLSRERRFAQVAERVWAIA